MIFNATFHIPQKRVKGITERLFKAGAASVSSEKEESGVAVKGLFCDSEISEIEGLFPDLEFSVDKLEESDWKNKWTESFTGVEVNSDIYIQPEREDSTEGYKYLIKLDPKDAFGAGTHPTTRICLNALHQLFERGVAKDSLVDIGTGTGVLAVYASMRGVSRIHAFDIEDDSVIKARYNAELNGVRGIEIYKGDIASVSEIEKFGLVVANLLTDIIKANIDHIVNLAKSGGLIVLSGISERWNEEVKELFSEKHLKIEDEFTLEGWKGFILTVER